MNPDIFLIESLATFLKMQAEVYLDVGKLRIESSANFSQVRAYSSSLMTIRKHQWMEYEKRNA